MPSLRHRLQAHLHDAMLRFVAAPIAAWSLRRLLADPDLVPATLHSAACAQPMFSGSELTEVLGEMALLRKHLPVKEADLLFRFEEAVMTSHKRVVEQSERMS